MSEAGLLEARRRMADRGIDPRSIRAFEHYYRQLEGGAEGTIPEESIEPLTGLARLGQERFSEADRRDALARTAVVKLNGGLGTSMGLEGPKSALRVRGELTFLDVIARQMLALRARYDVRLPLLLMNSFRTQRESLGILAAYPQLPVEGLPLDFLQGAEPKLTADDDLTPVSWPADPELEWCPPGHGDVYLSLLVSGLLDRLRESGFRYVFLSNADNLGATCDPDIAASLAANEVPFLAEVCERTVNDRKGGHLARRRSDGRLVLRESAMVVPGEEQAFGDIERHTTFNSNNLWVDLDVLARQLDERDGILGLPIIVNRKTVDPSDKASTPVIQLETAMGAAIETFEGAAALVVPRTRFRPVKTVNELLLVRSDRYALDDDASLVSTTDTPDPFVDLDGHYTLVPDFEARFPAGVPSIRDCTSLRVRGDVTFGADVVCVGDVLVESTQPLTIPDGTRLGEG